MYAFSPTLKQFNMRTVIQMNTTVNYARQLDADDVLAHFRRRFYLNEGCIYMDGNSLGLMSKDAEENVLRVMSEWKTLGINGWLDSDPAWHFYGETLGKAAAALVGADPSEVCMAGSTTVNLHGMMATFFRPQGKRTKILADELNFPSTLYALQGQLTQHGLDPKEHLILVKSRDGLALEEEDIIAAMSDEVCVAVLPGVLYRSGQLLNLKRLGTEARERGIIIGFDCAHSAGAVAHSFSDDDIDFATWCSYKHLNGGPGAPAFLFLNRRHFGRFPGMAGWYGSVREEQFNMNPWFNHAKSASGWQIGTPHVLSAAPLFGTLKIFHEAGMDRVRKKSLALTDYFMALVRANLTKYGFELGTPEAHERRGGHVALLHNEAWRICCALKAKGVIPDFRPDNVIRIAPVALYNTFEEVWRVVEILAEIAKNKEYEAFAAERSMVS